MRSRYRIRLRPQGFPALHAVDPGHSARLLTDAVAGSVVRSFARADSGDQLFEVELNRSTHEAALEELFVAAQQLGYAWVESTASEWADETVSCAIVGALGCGAAGSTSENGFVVLLASVVGGLFGTFVGSLIEREKTIYTVHRAYPRGWQLTPLTPSGAIPQGRLGFA